MIGPVLFSTQTFCFLQVSKSDVFQEVTMELAVNSDLDKYYRETIGSSAQWMTYVKK